MIYASDMDRTLVFSKKNFTFDDSLDKTIFESVDGSTGTFMTKRTLSGLRKLSERCHFVPITARNQVKYDQLGLTELGIRIEYAVIANGAVVLHNGERDVEWDRIIDARKAKYSYEFVREHLAEHFSDVRYIENDLGFEIYSVGLRESFEELFREFDGLHIVEDHSKTFLVYESVSKLAALEYVKRKLNDTYVVTSGDSILDLPMVLNSDVGIVPLTGNLASFRDQFDGVKSVHVIEDSTERSSEKLIEIVSKLV